MEAEYGNNSKLFGWVRVSWDITSIENMYKMGNEYHDKWMSILPWTLLGRRTAFQPELQASAAELVFGSTPKLPGDLLELRESDPESMLLLLKKLRQNASRPPVQPVHHTTPQVRLPADLDTVERVYVRRGKTATLGPPYDGPFKITQRLGDSCVKLGVGTFADGTPRTELQHLGNCKHIQCQGQPMPVALR